MNMLTLRFNWKLASLAAAMMVMAAGAQAQTTYNATNNGNWTTTTTWSPSTGTPGAGDTANVNSNSVTISAGDSILNLSKLSVGNVNKAVTGQLTINGGTLLVTNTTSGVSIGYNTGVGIGKLFITNGGVAYFSLGSFTLNLSGTNNSNMGSLLYLDNSTLTNSAKMALYSMGNQVVVTNGACARTVIGCVGGNASRVYIGGASGGNPATVNGNNGQNFGFSGASCFDNLFIVDLGGQITNVNFGLAGTNNCLSITNGGLLKAVGNLTVGIASGDLSNHVSVVGGGSVLDMGLGRLAIGGITGSTADNVNNSYVLCSNGGVISNMFNGTSSGYGLTVSGRISSNNYIAITSGGVVQGNYIQVGTNSAASVGNMVTNYSGGILQFTTATPLITVNNQNANLTLGNGFFINSGTISFSGVTLVNLTNNWVNSGIGTNTITWLGDNTLRLDNSTGTNTVAAGYTFYNHNGYTNYTGLELLNNSKIMGAKGLTIGDSAHSYGGSLIVSNGTVTIQGPMTNFSPNVNLAAVTLVASNGIVWGDGSAATTMPGTVTFDAITTNTLEGTVAWYQSASSTQEVKGVVKGSGPLQKTGSGVLILSGTNSYTAGAAVNNGTLDISGITTGAVSVASGSKLVVSGTLTGTVAVASGGNLSGAGTIAGSVTNSGAVEVTINVGGTATGPVVHGDLVLLGGAYLSLLQPNNLTSPTNYTMVTYTGNRTGQFDTALSNLPKGWRISYGTAGKVILMPGYPGTVFFVQ